jgi:hypothetical protein
MKFTQILTLLCALAATSLGGPLAHAQNPSTSKGDETILEMAQAFKKGDKNRLSALLPQTRAMCWSLWPLIGKCAHGWRTPPPLKFVAF